MRSSVKAVGNKENLLIFSNNNFVSNNKYSSVPLKMENRLKLHTLKSSKSDFTRFCRFPLVSKKHFNPRGCGIQQCQQSF